MNGTWNMDTWYIAVLSFCLWLRINPLDASSYDIITKIKTIIHLHICFTLTTNLIGAFLKIIKIIFFALWTLTREQSLGEWSLFPSQNFLCVYLKCLGWATSPLSIAYHLSPPLIFSIQDYSYLIHNFLCPWKPLLSVLKTKYCLCVQHTCAC